jgi:hypothetical protein
MYSLTKNEQYLPMTVVYAVSFGMVLLINHLLKINHSYNDGLYKFVYNCFFSNESKVSEFLTCTRGDKYYTISGEREATNEEDKKIFDFNQKYCITSLWAGTHIYLYILLGFYCPSLFWLTFFIGAAFEVFEYFKWECHDAIDVIYNSIGFGIGYYLNYLYFKNNYDFNKSIIIWIFLTILLILLMFNVVKKYQYKIDQSKTRSK